VLPVPLSPARLRERGYNQAWELARRLAVQRGLPAKAQWLQRLRDTPHQVGLSRSERERNLRDAMWVPPEGQAGVAGQHVALVDDVMTTGMTAAAGARALKAAGAASVQVWVVARTPSPES
jgi:ComF family protein